MISRSLERRAVPTPTSDIRGGRRVDLQTGSLSCVVELFGRHSFAAVEADASADLGEALRRVVARGGLAEK